MLSYLNGSGIVALLFEEIYQAFRGLEKCLVQAITFRQDPLIVATGQEVATIQSCRLLQCLTNSCHVLDLFRLRGSGKCPLKILDIEREDDLWSRLPLKALSIGGHKVGGVRERLAQLRQDLAQIGVCLGLSRIG